MSDEHHPHPDTFTDEGSSGVSDEDFANGDPPDRTDDATRLEEAERRLAEKEELVGVLTERLERAAEQLDRLKRSGVDRGSSVPGVPKELVSQQQALLTELQEAVQQWEEMQVGVTLERMEGQLAEVRGLLSGGARAATDATADQTRPAAPESDPDGPIDSAVWESFKEDVLQRYAGGDAGESSENGPTAEEIAADLAEDGSDVPDEPSAADHSSAADEGRSAAASVPQIEPLMDPPPEIDVENADVEALRTAVLQRDVYAGHLLARMRAIESSRAVDWKSLENAPQELLENLQAKQERLDEQLRLAEVELSLERARLGREASQLEMARAELEKEWRQLGAHDVADDEEDGAGAGQGRRWLRMLGIGRQDDPDDEE